MINIIRKPVVSRVIHAALITIAVFFSWEAIEYAGDNGRSIFNDDLHYTEEHIKFHESIGFYDTTEQYAIYEEAFKLMMVFIVVFEVLIIFRMKHHSKELYKQTVTDGLTKLFNQHHYAKELKLEIDRAHRYNRHLSLLSIDLDNFKKVNDTEGHLAGDRLLEMIGGAIQGNIRAVDIGCRSGGDEFTVILPETTLCAAKKVAEHVHNAIKGINGASIGIVMLQPGESVEDLLKRADEAMYAEKFQRKTRAY